MASYIGNMWSSLVPINGQQQMNIVSEEEAIGESIINFLLTGKGEDPFAPEYGIDFQLFQSFEDADADIWGFYIQEQLRQYVVGLRSVVVRVDLDPREGRARINIDYSTDLSNSRNTLAFPYHRYTGIQIGSTSINDFVSSIALNNSYFKGINS